MASTISTTSYAPPGHPYDVFVTFAKADAEWVRDHLAPQLVRHGLLAASEYSFVAGTPIIVNINQMVDECRYVLAVLSPAWLLDSWTRYTAVAALTADAATRVRRFVPAERAALPPLPPEFPRDLAVFDLTALPPTDDDWRPLFDRLTDFGNDRHLPRVRATATFRQIAELVRDPAHAADARSRMAGFRSRFEPEVGRIRELRRWKQIHDVLHDVAIQCYRPTLIAVEGFPKPESTAGLGEYARRLTALTVALAAVSDPPEPAVAATAAAVAADLAAVAAALADAVWFATEPARKLAAAGLQRVPADRADLRVRLAAAVPDYKAVARVRLDEAADGLRAAVQRQPALVNRKLCDLARTIELPALAATTRELLAALGDRFRVAPADLTAGADALEDLGRQRDTLLALHDGWQGIDNFLQATDAQVRGLDDTAEGQDRQLLVLTSARGWLRTQTVQLLADEPDRPAIDALLGELDAAVADESPFRAVQAFGRYCGQARQTFYNVDKALLRLCDALGGLGRQLSRMLSP